MTTEPTIKSSRKSGIRVMRDVKHGRSLITSALFGLAVGCCSFFAAKGILSGLLLVLVTSVLWARRDQHSVFLPLRVGLCVFSGYVGPMLIVMSASASSLRAGLSSLLQSIETLVVPALIFFTLGVIWGILCRALFRLFAYSIVIASDPCCWTCGYNLTENTTGRCPECGVEILPRPPVVPKSLGGWRGGLVAFGTGVCTAIVIAFVASWLGLFTHTIYREQDRWTISLANGAISAYWWDASLGGYSEGPMSLGAMFLSFQRFKLTTGTVPSLSIPLWLPLAIVGIPTINAWSRSRAPSEHPTSSREEPPCRIATL